MAKGRGKVRALTPTTDTVRPAERPFNSFFTPDWDKEAGAGQQIIRVRQRVREGQIKVPPGNGVAVRRR